ncbi:MAG: hypothetical protein SFU27_06465 [Thermonemataceae bacterium]|nr:hypothetical protein [Thermonemataceae bacterium]
MKEYLIKGNKLSCTVAYLDGELVRIDFGLTGGTKPAYFLWVAKHCFYEKLLFEACKAANMIVKPAY